MEVENINLPCDKQDIDNIPNEEEFIGNQPNVINVGDDDSPKWLKVPEDEELRNDHPTIENLDGSGNL